MTDMILRTVVRALERTVSLDPRSVSMSTRIEDLGIGRFSRLKLAICLEEACQVEIMDEDIAFFETVGDIVNYLGRWSLDLAA